MTSAIAADTVRMLLHVQLEQKVEREQVAKVTGTNKDDTAAHEPKKRQEKKVYPNDPCPCGSGKKYKQCCGRKQRIRGENVVELDQFKGILNSYEEPLKEMRDSL